MSRNQLWAMRWRPSVLLAVAIVLVLGVAGCGSSGNGGGSPVSKGGVASIFTGWPVGGKPVRGGTVTVDTNAMPGSFDPITNSPGLWEVTQVFDSMFEFMPGQPTGASQRPKLVGALVSSYSVSPDHLTYTFHVREGVKFSNGEPLTGEDIAFSLEQIEKPTAIYLSYTKTWKRIWLAGPMTVELQLTQPDVALPEFLEAPQCAIISKHAFEREGVKGFNLHPVGTGPFMVKSATPGFTTITMVRNPYYWRAGLPYLNSIVFNNVESENARILAVRSGAATIAQDIAYDQVPSLRSTPGVTVLVGPEWGAAFNFFNRYKEPFKQNSVRRALLFATPREQIIKSVYKGLGSPPNSLWGDVQYNNHNVPLFPYDIAKAKQELAKSSVPHGFSMKIEVVAGEAGSEQIGAILQSAWAQIGVHGTIVTAPIATLSTDFSAGKFDFQIGPPEGGSSEWYAPLQARFYMDSNEPGGLGPPARPSTVSKLNRAETAVSESEREKLFGEVQYATYWTEPMAQMLTNLVSLNLVSDKLRGFQEIPSTNIRMEEMWLQKG